MTSAAPTAVAWTCPFCALLCDGFAVSAEPGALRLHGSDCPRARAGLAQAGGAASAARPAVHGRTVEFDAAVAAAAQLLQAARQPLFAGMATDIAGARSLYALANHCNALIDHVHGDALLPGLRTLQDRGLLQTTLAEIRNRADLIVCFGTQPSADYPEFYRRCGVGAEGSPLRALVFVGTEVDPACAALAPRACRSIAWCDDAFITLALANALASGRAVAAPPALRELVAQMRAAQYLALVWEPASLPGPHAALLVESINLLAKTINRSTRAGGLALAGNDGGLAVNQALGWMSGLPLRTGVLARGLEHDPHRFAAADLLADHAVDALLWVASFGPHQPAPATAVPTIVLGHPDLAGQVPHGVFFPVATPGIGADGHLFRVDGVVVVPVHKVRDEALPTVAAVAEAIGARLAGLGGSS